MRSCFSLSCWDYWCGLSHTGSVLPLTPCPYLSKFLSPSLSLPLPQDNLTSATLPRNYKVSPLATDRDRRSDLGSYRRSMGSAGPSGTLPRSWQPVSRIPMPPSSPQPRNALRQRPIPLSMIFKLQNAFWEHGASRAVLPGSPIFSRAPPPKLPPQPPPQPPTQAQPQMPPQPQTQAQPQTPAPQQTWPPVNEGESARGFRHKCWGPEQLRGCGQARVQTLSPQRAGPDNHGNVHSARVTEGLSRALGGLGLVL